MRGDQEARCGRTQSRILVAIRSRFGFRVSRISSPAFVKNEVSSARKRATAENGQGQSSSAKKPTGENTAYRVKGSTLRTQNDF